MGNDQSQYNVQLNLKKSYYKRSNLHYVSNQQKCYDMVKLHSFASQIMEVLLTEADKLI